jgi:hypothetical protein
VDSKEGNPNYIFFWRNSQQVSKSQNARVRTETNKDPYNIQEWRGKNLQDIYK